MNRPSSKDRACISALLVTLIAFTSACAKREALPGDSVSEDGSVTLTPPKPTLTPKGLGAPPTSAGSREPLGAVEAALFSAELVMEHQGELGLEAPQREAIVKEIERGQAEMVRLQWDLQGEKEKLVRVLSAEHVDEKESAASAARVMERENKVKASHLAMLVRIKNHLTPAQQKKLRSLRGDVNETREPNDGGARDGG